MNDKLKIVVELDQEDVALAKYLGFATVEELIKHLIANAEKTKHCHRLFGEEIHSEKAVSVNNRAKPKNKYPGRFRYKKGRPR